MDTKGIVILRNLHNYDDCGDADFYICQENELVVDGFLHDTYNRYGIALDGNEAQDYSLDNTDSSMADDIQEAIMSKFKDQLLAFRADGEAFAPDDEDDYRQWCKSMIMVLPDGTVEVGGEADEQMSAFAKKYDEDNRMYTTATYVNYWDGSNRQTLLCSAQTLDYDAFDIMDYDDDDYAPLMEALAEYSMYIDNGTCKSEIIGNYEISHSLYVDDYFVTAYKVG